MNEREKQLEDALRAFLLLSWVPDAAPGPSCFEVYPVQDAREAMRNAGLLLTGASPFPCDNNGTVMTFPTGRRAVWLDGMDYDEHRRDRVPKQHLEIFDAAIAKAPGQSPDFSAVKAE